MSQEDVLAAQFGHLAAIARPSMRYDCGDFCTAAGLGSASVYVACDPSDARLDVRGSDRVWISLNNVAIANQSKKASSVNAWVIGDAPTLFTGGSLRAPVRPAILARASSSPPSSSATPERDFGTGATGNYTASGSRRPLYTPPDAEDVTTNPATEMFRAVERVVANTFNSSAPGQRGGDWREVEGSFVLAPPQGRTPQVGGVLNLRRVDLHSADRASCTLNPRDVRPRSCLERCSLPPSQHVRCANMHCPSLNKMERENLDHELNLAGDRRWCISWVARSWAPPLSWLIACSWRPWPTATCWCAGVAKPIVCPVPHCHHSTGPPQAAKPLAHPLKPHR
jgi:hypothetical protein